jgi:hypothetical protein
MKTSASRVVSNDAFPEPDTLVAAVMAMRCSGTLPLFLQGNWKGRAFAIGCCADPQQLGEIFLIAPPIHVK